MGEPTASGGGAGGPITVAVADGVATVLIDLPGESVNTLSLEVGAALTAALDGLEHDVAVKAVVIASGKADGFVAGARLEMIQAARTAAEATALSERAQAGFDRLERFGKPVVAAIHGACLGGGLELAMACHYRVAADLPRTALGLPEVMVGLLPGGGGTQRLPRLVGLPAALDLILTGRSLKARRALALGLVDEVAPAPLLREVARERALGLATGARPWQRPHRPAAGLVERVRRAALEGNPLGQALVYRQARAALLEKTHGHYPAPERALEVVRHGLTNGFQPGQVLEAQRFGELAVTGVSRRLVEIFFAQTALKKDSGVADPAVKARPVERVGVLGGGLMGSGIAAVTLQAGLPVRLRERDDAACAKAQATLAAWLDGQVRRRRLDKLERHATARLLTTTTGWEGLESVDVCLEAVFEDLDLKRQVLRAFEAVNPRGLFATNTSSIPIGEIAAAARRPEAVVGMHYFSPVQRMPLLEVIASERTSPEAIATAVALGKRQGKTVILAADRPGFWVNRILGPYVNEAAWLLAEGAAVEAIDRAMVGWGFPVGPVALLDEVGIDVGAKVAAILHAGFGERMRPPEALAGLVEAGRLGRKAGKGFYAYDGKRKRVDETVYDLLPGGRARRSPPDGAIAERLSLALMNEAARALAEGVVRGPRDGDVGAVFGIGFPPFRGGPFRALDAMGAAAAVEALRRLRDAHGERFEPAAALVEAAGTGRRYHAG